MSDLTLGVDVSDLVARLAIVNGGDVLAQGIVASNRSAAIKEAAKKAVSSAKGKVGAVAVALPSAHNTVPDDLAAALSGIGTSKPTAKGRATRPNSSIFRSPAPVPKRMAHSTSITGRSGQRAPNRRATTTANGTRSTRARTNPSLPATRLRGHR